jgi:hypothetical protein
LAREWLWLGSKGGTAIAFIDCKGLVMNSSNEGKPASALDFLLLGGLLLGAIFVAHGMVRLFQALSWL